VGDIPTLKSKFIDVTKFGVITDDGIDDSIAMLKALEADHKVKGSVITSLPKAE
jgi:hypothetical protein